jgi:hypothetical protein
METEKQSGLAKLKAGIFLAYQNKVNRDPGYDVIGYLTNRSSSLSKMNQYASDLEKITSEMDVAYLSIKELPEESYLKKLKIAPEDYVLYHQGYFLELVHQAKDKIIRLIDACSKIDDDKYTEKLKIKKNKIIRRPKIIKHQKLIDLINEWDQESEGPLSIVLKKRTNNHHFRSRLQLNSDYQDVKVSKLFEGVQAQQSMLTEHGVEQIELLGKSGFEKFHEETQAKILHTKEIVNQNIELISDLLINIFNFPLSITERGKRILLTTYNKRSVREIKNNTSIEKLQSTGVYYKLAIGIGDILKRALKDQLVSYYVIGSAARGNMKVGISDLNIVVVSKDEIPNLSEVIEGLLSEPQLQTFEKIILDVEVTVLSKEKFLHLDYFKTAFSCHYDGLLMFGEDLAKDKKYPSPGLGLAYILNKDFKQDVEKLKTELKMSENISEATLMRLVRKLSKYSLRMLFGEVMANHTLYAVEMKKIKELLIWAHPNNWQMIIRLYIFLRRKSVITNKESFNVLIEFCIEKLYPLIDDLENKSKGWLEEFRKKY